MVSNSRGISPTERLQALRKTVDANGFVRLIEAHSGLSALIAQTATLVSEEGLKEFDGIWESSLTDSGTKGLPDASIIGFESRLHTINEILQVTNKPLVVDGDTGGEIPQFEYMVTQLERLGVSAVIIEDKVFPKRNSLDATANQDLEDPETFAKKIQAGRNVVVDDSFMVIARLESLISGTGLQDALGRAEIYIQAGVDGIMIHSNRREPEDLFAFAKAYDPLCQTLGRRPVLVSVPTTYNHHSDHELAGLGFNLIIHANHLLRASHKAMKETATDILKADNSFHADDIISPVKDIFSIVGLDRITEADRDRQKSLRTPVIIPAAGRDPVFSQQPKSLIAIAGKRLLDFQLESIHKAGVKQVVIVRGHESEHFTPFYGHDENIFLCENPLFLEKGSLHSLMQATEHMRLGFAIVFSDILFDQEILSRLINSGKDIVLGIDSSYTYHQHEIDKKLDLVVTQKGFNLQYRSLQQEWVTEIARVGKDIDLDQADHEFIGMAYFSPDGAKILLEHYQDCLKLNQEPFQEASSFGQASITDMIQELRDRGFPLYGLKVNKGWREIHTRQDVIGVEQEMTTLLA